MTDVRVRFAPSPTGTLHIGSARTALYNYLFARHLRGTMVLRIEDTDLKRSQHAFEESIIRDLHWLGLRADEGPDVGGVYGPYRQSERAPLYEAGVQRLLDTGWAYHCFCTQERLDALKQEQLERGEMPKYDRRCLGLAPEVVRQRLAAGEEVTIRFQVPPGDVSFDDSIHGSIAFSSDVIGDFIIKRSDGGFAYNYAVVIDDAGMKITNVVRGEDHITNTARQIMLFNALGEPVPTYAHHSLIHGADGGKLSKRHGATSIGEFRDMGYLDSAVVNYLALLSWHPTDDREKLSLDEIVAEFDISRVSRSPAIFDIDKLNWLNGLYIRELPVAELAEHVRPYLHEEGMEFAPVQREIVAAAIQANLVVLEEAPKYAQVFVEEFDLADTPYYDVLAQDGVDEVFATLAGLLDPVAAEFLDLDQARDLLRALVESCKERGIKGKLIYQPVRIAFSGRDQGPDLLYLLAGLGRSRVLARLAAGRAFIAARLR
jgi:nondiscriminating glutamyl-tRNA synthetase